MRWRTRLLRTVASAGLTLLLPCSEPCISAVAQQPPQEQIEHSAVHAHRPAAPRLSPARSATALPALCASCIRENLEYLAGPALHGRGSATEDEHHAAEFIAGKLQKYGLQPAADAGDFIQTVTIESRQVIGSPTLSAGGNAAQGATIWAHGRDVVFLNLPRAEATGELQKLDLAETSASASSVREDAALAVKLKPGTTFEQLQAALAPLSHSKAEIVMISSTPELKGMFQAMSAHPPHTPQKIGNDEPPSSAIVVLVALHAFQHIWSLPDGAFIRVQGQLSPWRETHTWNVLAKIPGGYEDQMILLSAHLDHLGVVKGKTYPGADDDASGTVAVMELARALAREPKPKRTIVFALWGSEEAGMIGSRYFLQHPTFPLKDIIANLEFEMIGRPDPAVKPDELWLTGWDRSNLGPEMAAHGANLVSDPHPGENFFTRSDNFPLAQKGIVAQTVSSYGLHKDYHQPSDTFTKINWMHLDESIASMIGPVLWLANSDFMPAWKPDLKP